MIEIRACLIEGRSSIEVIGHGRETPGDLDGIRACAAVSTAAETAIAYMAALAEQDPEHIRFELTKE